MNDKLLQALTYALSDDVENALDARAALMTQIRAKRARRIPKIRAAAAIAACLAVVMLAFPIANALIKNSNAPALISENNNASYLILNKNNGALLKNYYIELNLCGFDWHPVHYEDAIYEIRQPLRLYANFPEYDVSDKERIKHYYYYNEGNVLSINTLADKLFVDAPKIINYPESDSLPILRELIGDDKDAEYELINARRISLDIAEKMLENGYGFFNFPKFSFSSYDYVSIEYYNHLLSDSDYTPFYAFYIYITTINGIKKYSKVLIPAVEVNFTIFYEEEN